MYAQYDTGGRRSASCREVQGFRDAEVKSDNYLNSSKPFAATEDLRAFSYSGPLTEMVLLGCFATRFEKQDLKWESKALKFSNVAAANQFVKKMYRKGFEVEGL